MNRADRKKLLIAQGAAYRAEACIARQTVRDGLQPRTLVTAALHHIARTSFAHAGNGGTNDNSPVLLKLLPLIGSVLPALSARKPALKKLLRGALIAVTAAGVVKAVMRHTSTRGEDDHRAG